MPSEAIHICFRHIYDIPTDISSPETKLLYACYNLSLFITFKIKKKQVFNPFLLCLSINPQIVMFFIYAL